MSKRRPPKCLGFPSGTDCGNKPGGRWSPYWCPDCDKKRMEHIGQQFDALKSKMDSLSRSEKQT